MSIVPSDTRKHGQPQRGGRLKKGVPRNQHRVKHSVKLNDELFDIIDAERRPGETWNDVILRRFREAATMSTQLRNQLKKILQSETLDQYFPKPATPAAALNMTPLTFYQ